MSKCERKVVKKFALEIERSIHSLYPTDTANKDARAELHHQLFAHVLCSKKVHNSSCGN
jgi:hypothetical protein